MMSRDLGCGGCRGMGSHRRWCPAVVGQRAATLGRESERAESIGDAVGSNYPAAANAAYQLAGMLREAATLTLGEQKK